MSVSAAMSPAAVKHRRTESERPLLIEEDHIAFGAIKALRQECAGSIDCFVAETQLRFENNRLYYAQSAFAGLDNALGLSRASIVNRARIHLRILAGAATALSPIEHPVAGVRDLERMRGFSLSLQALISAETPFYFAARSTKDGMIVVDLDSLRHL